MATEYNVLNSNFINKLQMENYEFANSSKPSCDFYHPIECKNSETSVVTLYSRDTSVPAGADARLYDLGNFQIATVGMQAASGVCGELWCTYEVELYKNKINEDSLAFGSTHFKLQGTIEGTIPLGSTTPTIQYDDLGCSINVADQTIHFPVDTQVGTKFLINYVNVDGSTATVIPPSIVATSEWNIFDTYGSVLTVGNAPSSGSTNANLVMNFVVQATGTSPVVGFGVGGSTPHGGIIADIIISRLSADFH